MDMDEPLRAAARDTLVHIAGVSGRAAKDLRPGQSLGADLGLTDPEFEVLADYQRRVGDGLRTDGGATALAASALYDSVVWEVLSLTVRRATGRRIGADAAIALLVEAASRLSGAPPRSNEPAGRG